MNKSTYRGLVQALQASTRGRAEVRLDLGGVSYCDLAGLRAIVCATGASDCEASDNGYGDSRRVVLHEVPAQLITVLEIVGWDSRSRPGPGSADRRIRRDLTACPRAGGKGARSGEHRRHLPAPGLRLRQRPAVPPDRGPVPRRGAGRRRSGARRHHPRQPRADQRRPGGTRRRGGLRRVRVLRPPSAAARGRVSPLLDESRRRRRQRRRRRGRRRRQQQQQQGAHPGRAGMGGALSPRDRGLDADGSERSTWCSRPPASR